MPLGDEKLYFPITNDGMTGSAVDKLLDPMGETLKDIARGRRGAGRLQVTVMWPQIERALDAGATVTMVWEALSSQGLVSIKLRGFSKEVKARREGARGSRTAPKPAAERRPSAGSSEASLAAQSGAPAQAAAARPEPPKIKRGIPDRPWRRGPHIPPDPTKVFKPRDPLADD